MAKIDRIQEMLDYGFGLDERVSIRDCVDYGVLVALHRTLNEVYADIRLADEKALIKAANEARHVGPYVGGAHLGEMGSRSDW